jgi:hypothetical protein
VGPSRDPTGSATGSRTGSAAVISSPAWSTPGAPQQDVTMRQSGEGSGQARATGRLRASASPRSWIRSSSLSPTRLPGAGCRVLDDRRGGDSCAVLRANDPARDRQPRAPRRQGHGARGSRGGFRIRPADLDAWLYKDGS